jgi:phosphatidylinositol alpha-mannosyltransferase
MKIGFVLDDSLDKADGVQQYVITLGQWLHHAGHEVHYLAGNTKRRDLPHVHSLSRNVQVHFNQNRMTTPLPANSKAIRQLLLAEDFDVLHVQMPYSPFMAGKVIKYAPQRTAVIGTFHILPFSRLESVATRLLGVSQWRRLKRFEQVVSVSEPAARFARKSFRLKTSVVPNAVNVTRFQAGKRLRKYDDGKLNIVYLGRLVERKGCMHLLQALDLLHGQNFLHSARVIIAGKGPLEAELKQYVQSRRMKQLVKFVGFVNESDKADLLASADIAVLPSTGGESFGIVLIEAMAAGADVVLAGNNPGYRTVMAGHGEQLVRPANTEAFAKVLKHFVIHAPARRKAKRWQQVRVQEYDVRVVGTKLLDIYTESLQKKMRK